jgi:WD40 repeat protein
LPHGDTVYSAVFSPDGSRIITAGGDSAVRIWDATTGTLVRELRDPDGQRLRYFIVVESPDGKLIAAIDTTGKAARVWDGNTGATVASLPNDASGRPALMFSADGRWLAATGGSEARVFDTSTWVRSLTIAKSHIHRLSWDPIRPHLLTGSIEGDVSIWDVPSGARLHHLRDAGGPIDAVAFAPNGELVAAASRDSAEQVWDARSGVLRSQSSYLRGKIQSIEFNSTSELVLAAGTSEGSGGVAVISDVAQGMLLAVLEGGHDAVRIAHFDPSSRRVVGAGLDSPTRIWDATAPYRRWSSPPVADDCGFMGGLEPDQRVVVVDCQNHATRVWDTARDQLLAELPPVAQVDGDFASPYPAVSAAGDRAAIGRGHAVEVYELPSGRLLRAVGHGADVNAVAFAPTGHDLISGAVDGSLLVIRDGRDPISLPVAAAGIDATAILVDGRVMAAAGKRLRVYDPDQGVILAELALDARTGSLRTSPDGKRAVSVSLYTSSATVPPMLWDLERYQAVGRLEGHAERVFSARFVAGGRILTAGGDGVVRMWEASTGRFRQAYRASSRFLADATLSPDGALVVGGANDGVLWFWDVATARALWTHQAHKSHIVGIHFEGSDVITRGFSGDVSRLALPRPSAVIEACSHRDGACGIVPR